ncbi:type II secretion system protein GspK [Luteibacter sp. SG786]|uniref:type II secretion system protein GspK n=1 Tax=Luteibacter sp. SG786 TaxID=2587130 RepID=UPI00141E7B9F|nr:general secretion pathway protein K [Luteibacter sp. SG786]
MRAPRTVRAQRGVALLVVLWGCTLAAITLGALASGAKVEGTQARGQYLQTKGIYAAEAGIEQAAYRLRAREARQRWAVDGRAYRLRIDDVDVAVSIVDEDGKLNLNTATPEQIGALLLAAGAGPAEATRWRDAIVRWGGGGERFADSLLAKGGFASLEELRRVPGLPGAIADRVEPGLTLWSTSGPNLAHAPAVVVAAMTGTGRELAEAYVADVRAMDPEHGGLPPVPGRAEGTVASLPSSGTVTVTSTATLGDGVVVRIDATLALQNAPGDPRAYRVLRWRESRALEEAMDVGGAGVSVAARR